MNKRSKSVSSNSKSICWDCENATNASECSWAESLEPVLGWYAKKTILGKAVALNGSFYVMNCPKFKRDSYGYGITPAYKLFEESRKAKRLHNDEAINLAEAIIEEAVEEWKALLFGELTEAYYCNDKIQRKDVLIFFFSEDFENLLSMFSERTPSQIRHLLKITNDMKQ